METEITNIIPLDFTYEEIPIESIESSFAYTFDFEVEDTHYYIHDNGLVSHNTIGLMMDCDTLSLEPEYSLVKWKNIEGESKPIPMLNNAIKVYLSSVKTKEEVQKILENLKKGEDISSLLTKDEIKVLKCAVGTNGIPALHYEDHLHMLAAAQPFLSGAISKTINLPDTATGEDVKNIYINAHRMGLKSVAIYRDGSKGAQALITQKPKVKKVTSNENLDVISPYTPKRLDLPSCRNGKRWELKLANAHKIFLSTGEYDDGSLGEIFIDLGYKYGTTMRALMAQFAVSTSYNLQYGVPLKDLVDRFTYTKFEPSGFVTGHKYIKTADSFIDLIFKVLGHHYLGRTDFLNIRPEKIEIIGELDKPINLTLQGTESCLQCGGTSFKIAGTCKVCTECGTSTGGCG